MSVAVAGPELKFCSDKAALTCLQPALPQRVMCILTHLPQALPELPVSLQMAAGLLQILMLINPVLGLWEVLSGHDSVRFAWQNFGSGWVLQGWLL